MDRSDVIDAEFAQCSQSTRHGEIVTIAADPAMAISNADALRQTPGGNAQRRFSPSLAYDKRRGLSGEITVINSSDGVMKDVAVIVTQNFAAIRRSGHLSLPEANLNAHNFARVLTVPPYLRPSYRSQVSVASS